MGQYVVQHCDLTELYNGHILASKYNPQSGDYDRVANLTALNEIKTEFAFATVACAKSYQSHVAKALTDAGFSAITTMSNWFYSHSGQWRPITFYWKRMKSVEESEEVPFKTTYWYTDSNFVSKNPVKTIHASGCGFGLNFGRFSNRYWRYFTLFRTPLSLTPGRENWLKMRNFRLLDTGKFAKYYINGWDAESYTVDKEKEYWTGVGVSLNANDPVKFDPIKVYEWRKKNGY